MRCTGRIGALALWPGLPLLYLGLPGHPLGLLRGLPLDDVALVVAAAAVLSAWLGAGPQARIWHRAALCLAVGTLLKVLLATPALSYGLEAAYTTSPDPIHPVERSTEWRLEAATRVDARLDFVGDQFPVHFFNDLRRFNFYAPSQPRRDLLPFAATWRGWLYVPEGGQHCVRLQANGSASLSLGALPALGLGPSSHVEMRDACGLLERGPVPLELQFARPEGGAPFISASELAGDGRLLPFTAERLLRVSANAEAVERDYFWGHLAWLVDAVVLTVCLAILLSRLASAVSVRASSLERPLLVSTIAVALIEALVEYHYLDGRTAILSGGNDWLAYESYGRDVLLNGPLMTAGKPLGQGEPFYYQPLYPYFLAALHALLGESLYGILVAQYVLVAVSGVLTYLLARELFGRASAVATLGLFWLYRYLIFNQVAGLLLSENLVILLVPPMLLLLVRWQSTWRRAELAGAGVLLGMAILTRSTPILFLPPAIFAVTLAQLRKFHHWRAALGAAGLLGAVTLAIFGLTALRNLAVAGRPVLLPESASTNIYETHRPSAGVDLSHIDRDPLYERLGLDRRTREVAEFIRQDPLGYIATLVPMGLYAVGFTGPALGTSQIQYEVVLLSGLYVAGLVFVPAVRATPVWMLHAFVMTHFLQMMVFMSHQYGFRLPLPMYGPMTVVAGRTLVAAAGRIAARSPSPFEPRSQLAGRAAAAAFVALLTLSAWQLLSARDVEARVFGLGGDAAASARAVAHNTESWLADRIYFSGQDGRSLGVAYLPGLAYRDMKWIDATRALVWPPDSLRGLLVRPTDAPTSLARQCWPSSNQASRDIDQGATDRVLEWIPAQVDRTCATSEQRLASFSGYLDLLAAFPREATGAASHGSLVAWRVVQRPSFRVQVVTEAIGHDELVLSTNVYDPYPSGSWERGELVVARLDGAQVDSITVRREGLGFTRGSLSSRLVVDDPLALYGQVRVLSSE